MRHSKKKQSPGKSKDSSQPSHKESKASPATKAKKLSSLKASSKHQTIESPLLSITPINLALHPSLVKYFGYTFVKAAMRFKVGVMEACRPYDLVPIHFGVLAILRESEPLNQVTLGEILGIDKATMVKLIDSLEKSKYVQRQASDTDRRAKLIAISDKGRKAFEKILGITQEAEDKFLAPLSATERKEFNSMLRRLVGF